MPFQLKILILISLLLGIIACGKPVEGCLDVAASNYNVNADDNCCCEYPNLVLSFTHLWDSVGVNKNSLKNDVAGNFFNLLRVQYYISDIELIDLNDNIVSTTDTVLVLADNGTISPDSIWQLSNFTLCNNFVFDYKIGNFKKPNQYKAVRFKVGLNSPMALTQPDYYTTGNPLSQQLDTMFDPANGYLFNKWTLDMDTAASSSDSLVISTSLGDGLVPVVLSFTSPILVEEGYDARFPIRVNYQRWFNGINVLTDDAATIRAKILANTASAFEVL